MLSTNRERKELDQRKTDFVKKAKSLKTERVKK